MMNCFFFLKFSGQRLKYWEYRDVLYAHRTKFFSVPAGKKVSLELNRCLCDILANQLFLELNQCLNDHKVYMLHLDTTLSTVIIYLVVVLMY